MTAALSWYADSVCAAFLLGRELQTGYRLWRVRVADEHTPLRDG